MSKKRCCKFGRDDVKVSQKTRRRQNESVHDRKVVDENSSLSSNEKELAILIGQKAIPAASAMLTESLRLSGKASEVSGKASEVFSRVLDQIMEQNARLQAALEMAHHREDTNLQRIEKLMYQLREMEALFHKTREAHKETSKK
jgi:hypothetical protein